MRRRGRPQCVLIPTLAYRVSLEAGEAQGFVLGQTDPRFQPGPGSWRRNRRPVLWTLAGAASTSQAPCPYLALAVVAILV